MYLAVPSDAKPAKVARYTLSGLCTIDGNSLTPAPPTASLPSKHVKLVTPSTSTVEADITEFVEAKTSDLSSSHWTAEIEGIPTPFESGASLVLSSVTQTHALKPLPSKPAPADVIAFANAYAKESFDRLLSTFAEPHADGPIETLLATAAPIANDGANQYLFSFRQKAVVKLEKDGAPRLYEHLSMLSAALYIGSSTTGALEVRTAIVERLEGQDPLTSHCAYALEDGTGSRLIAFVRGDDASFTCSIYRPVESKLELLYQSEAYTP